MKHCRVTINGRQSYEGLFVCTCDAMADAMERFPQARRISVKVVV